MANNNHNNNNRKRENSNNNHYNRFRGNRNRHRDNYENREHNVEEVEVCESHRENRERRDSQAINTFTLGTKELEGKNAEFQYDKGWYSIVDVIDEEKNVIYKSKNAQEAYTKWNVYIGRKKERASKAEKAE